MPTILSDRPIDLIVSLKLFYLTEKNERTTWYWFTDGSLKNKLSGEGAYCPQTQSKICIP